ncbi:hypothetical protein ACJMK2_022601 [Sinanodonta woodiana]|uniref:Uncharacterized protein n=1 Tax=Sinanodonta woodiana TaxID=1069815 RepID=A0ABD3TLB4_SINWO
MKPDLAKYCLTLALTSACSMYIVHGLFLGQIDCLTACRNHDTDPIIRDYCGCFDSINLPRNAIHQHHPILSTTTEDVCAYLCSIQMGGDACGCSKPILGGRK